MMSAEGPGRQTDPQSPWLEVGRVARPHGLQGEVIVDLVTNRTERLDAGSRLSTGDRELEVRRSFPHQERYRVAFAGVSTRDAADALRGAVLTAPPVEDPDVLWAHHLVGARVVDSTGRLLGQVVSLEANPASDLLVLEAGGLVPLCFVVEHTQGCVVVDPPAGLLDTPVRGKRPEQGNDLG